jgi:AcrR family transcriptional regulator
MANISSHKQENRQVTAAQIVQTALEIAEKDGLDGLTVRSIASAMGVGTMTLYGYFRSKDEILDAVADHVLGNLKLDPPASSPESPVEALYAVGYGLRRMMRQHASVIQILASRVTYSQAARQGAMESVLNRLIVAGIPGELAVKCYGFLMIYALGFSIYQQPRPWGDELRPDKEELARQMTHYYASLPQAEFPHLVALKEAAVGLPTEEQFKFGLDCVATMMEGVMTGETRNSTVG